MENRVPSRCRITPGASIVVAGYTTQPMARSGDSTALVAPPGIHGLDLTALVWPGQLVEIPPWDPVLRGQHRGVLAEQWLHERTAGRVAMRLEAEEDIVDGPDVRGVVGGVGVGHEIASRTENLHTVLSHRTQVLVARDQVDFGASSVQRGTPVGADRSGTDDCNSHGDSLLCILYGQPRPAYGQPRLYRIWLHTVCDLIYCGNGPAWALAPEAHRLSARP